MLAAMRLVVPRASPQFCKYLLRILYYPVSYDVDVENIVGIEFPFKPGFYVFRVILNRLCFICENVNSIQFLPWKHFPCHKLYSNRIYCPVSSKPLEDHFGQYEYSYNTWIKTIQNSHLCGFNVDLGEWAIALGSVLVIPSFAQTVICWRGGSRQQLKRQHLSCTRWWYCKPIIPNDYSPAEGKGNEW